MIWFGSSAGVALTNMYPQAKSVGLWLRHGWHVALAYVIGFFVLLTVLGWHPNAPHKPARAQAAECSAPHACYTIVQSHPPVGKGASGESKRGEST